MNRRITQVAVAAAAAMALSLAAPVSAQANESAAATRGSASTAVTAPVTTSATGAVRFTSHAVLTSSSSTFARTAVSISAPGAVSWYVRGDVFVNGVLRLRDTSIASHNYPTGSIYWPRAAGYGTAQLRNVRVESYDAAYNKTVSPLPASNVIQVRRGLSYSAAASIVKRGSKLTLKAKGWKVYQPNGSTVRVPKITVKRYYKGKWRNVKHVKLNRNGHGKVSWKSKKKYKYRVYLKGSSTVQGTFYFWKKKV